MAKALVREVHALDPNLAPGEVISMREHFERTTAVQRVAVMMLGVFGGLALLLAAIGRCRTRCRKGRASWGCGWPSARMGPICCGW